MHYVQDEHREEAVNSNANRPMRMIVSLHPAEVYNVLVMYQRRKEGHYNSLSMFAPELSLMQVPINCNNHDSRSTPLSDSSVNHVCE